MNGKGYKLMYKIVKYYPNIMVFLDTSKLLTNFFDLIGVDKNTPFITMNALHFLTSVRSSLWNFLIKLTNSFEALSTSRKGAKEAACLE